MLASENESPSHWAAKNRRETAFEAQEGRLDPAIGGKCEYHCHEEPDCLSGQQLPARTRMKQAQRNEESGIVQHIESIADLTQSHYGSACDKPAAAVEA